MEATDSANIKVNQLNNLLILHKLVQTASQEILTRIIEKRRLLFQNKITITIVHHKIIRLL